MIAAVAALRQRVLLRLPLEVRARHVVEEQVVVEGEQFPQAADQVLLERGLVRQQAIQGAIAPVVGHQRGRHRQQIVERSPAIPVFGEMQLTGGLAQAGEDENRRHGRPRDLLAAARLQALTDLVQAEGAPQGPAKPDVAKPPTPLQPDPIEPNSYGLGGWRRGREEIALLTPAGDRARQDPGPRAALGIELAEVRHGLLDHLPPDAHRAHETPVGVRLPVLHARRVAQVHPPRLCAVRAAQVNQLGRHYMPTSGSDPRLFARLRVLGPRIRCEPVGELRKLG